MFIKSKPKTFLKYKIKTLNTFHYKHNENIFLNKGITYFFNNLQVIRRGYANISQLQKAVLLKLEI